MSEISHHYSPTGTHPSWASNMHHLRCDSCGVEFRADARIDDRWEFQAEPVGIDDGDDGDRCWSCFRAARDAEIEAEARAAESYDY